VTQAANISWERRSVSGSGASPAVVGVALGAGATFVGVGSARPELPERIEESRPHCGQTASEPEPVDWSATWQLGQSVFTPVGVNTGAGAAGVRIAAERDVSGTAAAGAGGTGREAVAQRTVRRPGS
jgi:hypothetical protein